MLDISEKRFLAILPQINFLLSLLIVFHHGFISIVRYNGSFSPFSYGLTVSIERYLYNISECAVPFFFFLSAYLFYRTYDGSWSQYLYKIKRRFWSLLIPYIIFGTIGVGTRSYGQNAIFSKYPIKSVSNISKNELINFYCIDYNSLPISIVNCHLESNNIGQLLQASKTKLVFYQAKNILLKVTTS